MAKLPILNYPDPRLSRPCATVTEFGPALRQLADDLLETMRAAPGVGITAGHVGIPLRVVVLELLPDKPLVYVNPVILSLSGETKRRVEGSVSMRGFTEDVERPCAIRFRYQDLAGGSHEEDATDFHAICIQHEVDQLDGIFWLKRLSRLKRDRLIRKWQKQNGA
ncbi:peptide deformylase [Pseudorhizobium endolithicum]|uniref:Peptide deformylase-like n=1 Tax=Pseudorhizobium endolithicum TaxID=1191678 RepID=A0ABN7JYB6_9HYPH|nr:peptide deformylase [Pseudorhizobium endolithicum]CAD6415625.1 peptide deformylase [Rhizobium sp. Q54]CAD7054116.1 peptide deformylase [Pseudorhizobium endolithicum]